MKGKCWNRAVRGHKLMYEALQRLLLEKFRLWQQEQDTRSYITTTEHAAAVAEGFSQGKDGTDIQAALDELLNHMDDFTADFNMFIHMNSGNLTLMLWKQYIDFVGKLLLFIRAEREGLWELHLASFQELLPLMVLYDHTNYTRWGTIYITDMLQLEDTFPDVYREFMAGHFVVKEAEGVFNQVSIDMALEHINRLCKSGGGLVGITQSKTALDRWMLTCCDRSQILEDACLLVGYTDPKSEKLQTQKEKSKTRLKRDEDDVQKIMDKLREFNPFNRDRDDLIQISTNDVVPPEISQSLLSAEQRGANLLSEFVETRLGENGSKSLHDRIPQNKASTCSAMFTMETPKPTTEKNTFKHGRNLFRRLLSAAHSGRDVNLPHLLTHELSQSPPSLTTLDGQLRTTNKAALSHLLTDAHVLKELPTTDNTTCVVIDGMALVQAIGKPAKAKTFGDLADIFTKNVFKSFSATCTRIDVVFDRYLALSTKSTTRTKRNRTKKIRK